MLRPAKYAEKIQQDKFDASLSGSGFQLHRRRLVTDDGDRIRNQIQQDLPVGSQNRQNTFAPQYEALLAFGQQLANQIMKSGNDGSIGNIAVRCVKLSLQK